MNRKTLATLWMTLLLAAAVHAAPATEGAAPGEWTMDFEAAQTLAAETERPLFLNFTGSDWCGWCKLMDAQVFSKEEWTDHARENLVLVWIDFPRDQSLVPERFVSQNKALSRKFDVQGFPTYILLDADGQTVLGQAGASRDATPESFIRELNLLILASAPSVARLRDTMTDEQKARLDAAQSQRETAIRKLQDWIQTEPERTEENTAAFHEMRKAIDRATSEFLQILQDASDASS